MKESIKTYLKKMFTKKQVITKLIILAIAAVIAIIPSVALYAWLVKMPSGFEAIKNGFIYIYVTYNPGIAFSGLSGNAGAIFAIQSIVFIVLLAVYWLLVNDKVSASFVALAIFGGLFNLFQRACHPQALVLDYFKFGFWPNFAIFNWPDVNVVIGVIGFVISYIVHLILQIANENKDSKTPTTTTPVSTIEQPTVVEKQNEVRQI